MATRRTMKSDYEVGYARPPKRSQFQKGQSGNPGGRRKRPPSLEDVVNSVLASEIVLTEDGQRRTATKLEGLVLAQFQRALKDPRSAALIFGLYQRYETGAAQHDEVLPEEEQDIITRAVQRATKAASPPDRGGHDE